MFVLAFHYFTFLRNSDLMTEIRIKLMLKFLQEHFKTSDSKISKILLHSFLLLVHFPYLSEPTAPELTRML